MIFVSLLILTTGLQTSWRPYRGSYPDLLHNDSPISDLQVIFKSAHMIVCLSATCSQSGLFCAHSLSGFLCVSISAPPWKSKLKSSLLTELNITSQLQDLNRQEEWITSVIWLQGNALQGNLLLPFVQMLIWHITVTWRTGRHTETAAASSTTTSRNKTKKKNYMRRYNSAPIGLA